MFYNNVFKVGGCVYYVASKTETLSLLPLVPHINMDAGLLEENRLN